MTAKKFQLTSTNYMVERLLIKAGYKEVPEHSANLPDFIVAPGGADVNPRLYFEPKEAKTNFDSRKDMSEFSQIIAARLAGIPQVGICRGLQLLHVSTGGTLVQHIDGHTFEKHDVLIGPGEFISVTSSHHQAVPRSEATQYEEVYHAVDGTVEAFVSPSRLLGGVQWHPEYATASQESIDFFIAIIEKLTSK